MQKEAKAKSTHNFFDAPLRVKLGEDACLALKIDAFYCGNGMCVFGGWASEPLEIGLEADGQEVSPIISALHLRKDVNAALAKTDETARAFGFAANAPVEFSSLELVCANRELNIRFKLPLPLEKAKDTLDPAFEGVLGEDVYEIVRREISRKDSITFARDGQIDYAFRLASPHYGNCLVLFGWAALPEGANMYARTGEKQAKIPLDAFFWPRADIEKGKGPLANPAQAGHGFMAVCHDVPLPFTSMELWWEKGAQKSRIAKKPIEDLLNLREFINSIFSLPVPWSELASCYAKTLLPVLPKICRQHHALLGKRPVAREKVGNPAQAPKISVIVPLYGNLKFLTDQVMSFSEDPVFENGAELIFVIDDCSLIDAFRAKADDLHGLFGLPFRWAFNGSNNGFSGANNLGAAIARGKYLVFMNSDVFPEKTGWLEDLCGCLENDPEIGVAGCRLMYPSGTIQHAGMDFKFRDCLKIWTNRHPGQGCDPLFRQGGSCEVPAVTGACMALEKKFFEKLGGWSGDYLVGDFEDSDLCLKARELGKKVVYLPHVSLVHLERQTFRLWGAESLRQRTTICNAVIHQNKWQKRLAGQNTGMGA